DAPRGQEGAHPVGARTAVDVLVVVAVGVERLERLAVALRPAAQEVVERLLPRRPVHGRGLGQYAVEVEQTRRYFRWQAEHTPKLPAADGRGSRNGRAADRHRPPWSSP